MLAQKIRSIGFGLGLFCLAAMQLHAADSRITLPSGKKIFLSGMNLAWINFASDVGDTPLDTARVGAAMKAISDSGGNCMRIWLSTNGTNDPKYGADSLVKGPGTQTIANIQQMLKLAKKNNMLVMPVLLTHNFVEKSLNPTILAYNKKLLKTDAGLQAYINNYLKPVVTAIGNDPNLACWEICNEPEGMVQGWSSPANTITQTEVQKMVNWFAAAIHDAAPQALVSNGNASLDSRSWYTDAALKTAGGKANGTLNFYMAHYYGWNGSGASPFTKPCSYWGLDKPLVIGEYASSDWSRSTPSSSAMQDDGAKVDTLLKYLDNAGYAGGLGWQYQPDNGDPWMKGFATFGPSLRLAFKADSASIKLTGNAGGNFAVIVGASNGGTVKTSIQGRVDSLKTDTITAIAATGYTFSGWAGDTTASGPVLIIKSVVKDWSIQANFTPNSGTNLIKGGDFSDNTQWTFYFSTDKNTASIAYTNQQANVTITKTDTANWGIQLSQGGIPLTKGVTLAVTFDAWSTGARSLGIGMNTAVTWHYQGGATVNLTASKKTYTVEITPDSSTTAGILQFDCGGSLLPVYIDNVSVALKTVSGVLASISAVAKHACSYARVGDRVLWSAASTQAKATLTDLSGKTLRVAAGKSPIYLTGLPSGLYLFTVIDDGKRATARIVR